MKDELRADEEISFLKSALSKEQELTNKKSRTIDKLSKEIESLQNANELMSEAGKKSIPLIKDLSEYSKKLEEKLSTIEKGVGEIDACGLCFTTDGRDCGDCVNSKIQDLLKSISGDSVTNI